jgi:hypothetical protein
MVYISLIALKERIPHDMQRDRCHTPISVPSTDTLSHIDVTVMIFCHSFLFSFFLTNSLILLSFVETLIP